MTEHKRPGWDEYFMELAQVVAKRSTCLRRNVGAIVVRTESAGYGFNGSYGHGSLQRGRVLEGAAGDSPGERVEMCEGFTPSRTPWCKLPDMISLEGSVIYCTNQLCHLRQDVVNAGIRR